MRARILGLFALAAVLSPVSSGPAVAQTAADVHRELQEMRRQYDAELKRMQADYEARIKNLEARVRAAEARATAPTAAQPVAAATAAPPLQPGRAPAPQMIAAPAPSEPAAPQPGRAPAPQMIGSSSPGSDSVSGGMVSTPGRTPVQSVYSQPAASAANGSNFNPAIGVVLDGRFAAFDRDPSSYSIPAIQFPAAAGLGPQGFGIGESELSFTANVDDKLYGQLIASIDGNNVVSVEEAFIQSLALPFGFTAKAGRFFSGIGYLNSVHRHAWDFADQALPYRAFLSDQYDDDGVQLRWLAPTPFLLEFGGELFRGAAYPYAAGNNLVGSGAAFVHLGDDITPNMSYRLGASYLRGGGLNRTTDNGMTNYTGTSSVAGIDGVFKWAPTGNASEQQLKLQAELLYREDNGSVNGLPFLSPGLGWYAQAVYRFLPSWEIGVRADSVLVNNYGAAVANAFTLQGWGVPRDRQSVALTYYTSEFGRFRLQYNRDQSSGWLDDQFLLQYTVSLGAHGAHNY